MENIKKLPQSTSWLKTDMEISLMLCNTIQFSKVIIEL